MFQLIKFVPVFLLLTCVLQEVTAAERFFVNISGSVLQIESVKRRSEYRMSKNVDFCRGVKMPKAVSGWRCQKNKVGQAACSQEYECTFVDKNFNRKSESMRTYRAMKAVPAITTAYSIGLSAKPKLLMKVKPAHQVTHAPVRAKAVATPSPGPTPQVVQEDDLFAQLEDQEVAPQEAPKAAQEDLLNESFADEKPQTQKSSNSNEEVVSSDSSSDWDWLRFDVFMTQTSDESGSQTALEAGWRPRWSFADKWSLEGRLGLSQRKPIADTEEDAFSVIETAAWLGRRFGSWRLAAGYGRQSWSGEGDLGSQTPTFVSGSVAYYWSDVQFYVFEGIELQYLSISDEASSTAIRAGFLIDF